MGLHGTESIASSGVAQGLDHLPLKDGILSAESEQDDLLQAPSLEAGIFGVLFTLSQEKNQQHIRYHWILLKILLDSWQLYTTIMAPEMGWDFNPQGTAWKVVNVLSFQWLKDLGYAWYIAVLYSMAGLLAINLGLCVWVAWSFKEQKFDYVWPIKVVRGFSYVFLQVFDITSLNFLQLGISCNYVGPVKPHLHMALFPQYSCSATPHIIHAVVSGMLLLIFVAVAMLVNMSEVEVNPASKSPQALGHSGAEVTAFGIKALMTLVNVFLGWPKVAAVAYLLLAFWLAWVYIRWVPHLLTWVNCLKSGVAVAVFGVAAVQVAVVCLRDTGHGDAIQRNHTLTILMAIGLGPAFLLGALAAWLRTRLFTSSVLKAFRTADPEAIKPQDVYHFYHPRDVEVAARSARVWTDLYTLEKQAVHRAENIIKAGVALFPEDAFVSLTYANFMLDMLGFSQTGTRQLESVRKLNPGIMCRFMLFVRQQQATQKAASSTVGKGGNMDLLGYVEYQRKQRMVLRHHKDALQAMANFWRILGSSTVSFSSLSKSLEEIDNSVSQAETAYRVVLELYNNSPRLVRLYARFLETIKQDPWSAAEYHAAAARLEENKDEDGQGPMLPDGTPIGRMDDVEKGVVVVNAFGDIQVANRKLHSIFGYKKGELDGKNVMVLMPPHEAKRHPGLLRRYIDSGDKAAPYFKHPVLAIHRERVVFTVRIAVSRASGLGEDSVFIGIVEALPTEPGLGRVWVTREGVIVCCDPGFVTCFGYHPEDILGAQLDKLLRTGGYDPEQARTADVWVTNKANHDNHELVNRMLEAATGLHDSSVSSAAGGFPPPLTCSVLHKYDFAKEVTITVHADLKKSAIYEVRMQLTSIEPQLLMVVERKGQIRHMSGDLAKILGVGLTDSNSGARGQGNGAGGTGGGAMPSGQAMADDQVMLELMADEPQRSLDDFLPTPWKILHYKYRKYVSAGNAMLAGAWGCRAGGSVGPTMQLVGLHGKPVFVHVSVSSREEDGEPTHVVRMSRSCLETAIAERRIRVRVSEDGTVQELCLPPHDGNPSATITELFGFPAEQLVGCRLWDFMSLQYNSYGTGAGGPNSTGQTPPPQPRDVVTEAEDPMGEGGGGGGGVRISDAGTRKGAPRAPSRLSGQNLNFYTYDQMITNSLQTPGISWRVNVVPPSAAAEAAAMGNPARATAVLSRRTKEAVMRLDVVLPAAGSATSAGPGKLLIHAELWVSEAVCGVLEINASGRVSSVLEDDIRPPGLLFGLAKEDIVGSQFGSLLRLGPGQSAPGLLTESGVAKKSSLKSSSGKSKVVEKVGPVHYLDGFHRDHQPLYLSVQVVGKPGPGNPVTAIVRVASEKTTTAYRAKRQSMPGPTTVTSFFPGAAGAGGGGGGAGGASFGGPMGPKSHVHLSLGDAGPQPALSMIGSPPAPVGPQLRLREASFARGPMATVMSMPTPSAKGASSFRLGRSNDGRANPLLDEACSMATADPRASLMQQQFELIPRKSGDGREVLQLDSTDLPGTPQPAPVKAMDSSSSLRAPPMPLPTGVPRVPSDLAPSSGSGAGLPGAGVLAAGVACVIKSKSISRLASSQDALSTGESMPISGEIAAAAANGDDGEDAAAAAAKGRGAVTAVVVVGGTRQSSPQKPESPPTAPGKRSVISPRTDARLVSEVPRAGSRDLSLEADGGPGSSDDGMREGEEGKGGDDDRDDDRDDDLETAILALGEGDGEGGGDDKNMDSGLGGVDKWVASGGQFYRNRLASRETSAKASEGGDMDLLEEEEAEADDQSVGATSRATSSHWGASPRASASGMPPEMAEPEASFAHPHHHHRGAPGGLGPPDGYGGPGAHGPGPAGPGGVGGDGPPDGPPGTDAGAFDDIADDRSDGGESAISGISGASGLSDPNTPADFKRGKRYRKLVKLMDSPQAQRAVVRLKVNTALAVFAAGAVHVLCFAFIITAINKQERALDQLATAGGAQRYLQRALVAVRAMDVGYQGRGNSATYDIDDVEMFADDLMTYTTMYRDVNNDLLFNSNNEIEDLYYTEFLEVWSGFNATTQAPYYENMTLWDMVTRSFVSAKAIFQNHVLWNQQGFTLSSVLPAAFLINSGQQLILGMRRVLGSLLDVAVARTNDVNVLQLTFLIIEGFVVTTFTAAVLMIILRNACDQRYQLYETFLKIPVGLTRALASQTTHLLDDDESEDEEDEDPAESKADHAEDAHQKRKAAFDDNVISSNGAERSPLGRAGSNTNKHGVMSPLRGPHGNHGAKGAQLDDAASCVMSPVKGSHRGAKGGESPLSNYRSQSVALHAGGGGGADGDHFTLLLSTNSGESVKQHRSLWARFTGVFRRSNAVQPFPGVDLHRRTLERNSRVSDHMLVAVVAYSLLVILFYSITYAILLKVKDMVALQAVADHTTERTYRAVFYAQELAAEQNMTALPDRIGAVRTAGIALRDAYYTLRMGNKAWTAVGPNIERFPMANGGGIMKESSGVFDLFYSHDACLRLDEHGPCPPSSYRFYQVTHSGVDGMMVELMAELKYLADEAEAAWLNGANPTGLNSSRWDYVYSVGTVDLTDGNLRVSSKHVSEIKSVFQAVVVMHAVLFLLLMGVFLCFLLFVYVPLLRRMNKEKRRIAEMMSQLPAELDVMRLVSTALMGPKHVHSPHSQHPATLSRRASLYPTVMEGRETFMTKPGGREASTTRGSAPGTSKVQGRASTPPAPPAAAGAGAAGNGEAAESGGAEPTAEGKGYQTWKDILNRTTSVNAATAAAVTSSSGASVTVTKRTSGKGS